MQRLTFLMLVVLLLLVGCNTGGPIAPYVGNSPAQPSQEIQSSYNGPYRLWGEWTFYINAEHDRVDVVPRREGRFHLNALKFLEEYCDDCLEIQSIHNNGDGTLDLEIAITHPFPGLPEYTGFDVKGIIMFNGSHEFINYYETQELPRYPLWPESYRVSWRLLGDPELLNADGFTYRWTPTWDSGSELPIFNYWKGKYASGVPTANINGYIYFYSNENRYMFEQGKKESRTYHIWLPQGPLTAGYAVEACWEPPINTPVTNPIEDFPITANQPEAYHFKMVINDGNPITDEYCCNVYGDVSVHQARAEVDIWYPSPGYPDLNGRWVASWAPEFGFHSYGVVCEICDGPPGWRCMAGKVFGEEPNGTYQLIAIEYNVWTGDPYIPIPFTTFDVFEVVVDVD